MFLRTRNRTILFPRRPLIMGIVNLNDDSFSGDGSLDPVKALSQARQHIAAGADIIDIGGESARTNRQAINETAEILRVKPFIEEFPSCFHGLASLDREQLFPPLLAINTWRNQVARALLATGGDILNDMSGLSDSANARAAAEAHAALVIMHIVGRPKEKHTHVRYADVVATVHRFFADRIEKAVEAGLEREALILDPALDFAKQSDDNLRVLRDLRKFRDLDRPLLLAPSRKTVIDDVLTLSDPSERDAGTVACVVAGLIRGAAIFRVHNVAAASEAVRVLWPVISQKLED